MPKNFDVSVFESIINGIVEFVVILKSLADSVLGWLPSEIRYFVGLALGAMIVIKVIKIIVSKGVEL